MKNKFLKKAHRFTRLIYLPRVFGWFSAFVVLFTVFYHSKSAMLWALLVISTLLWPHLALFLALKSKNPKRTEYANLLADSLMCGLWTAAVMFNPWVFLMFAGAVTINTLSMGGIRLYGLGILSMTLGVGIAGALTGFSMDTANNPATAVCAAVALVAYSGAVSLTAYRQALAISKKNRLIMNQREKLQEGYRRLKEVSLTDGLTGLKNRRYLQQTIYTDLADVNRQYSSFAKGQSNRMPSNTDVAFFMIDMDHFKVINDRHGHEAGDAVLIQVSQVLTAICRKADTVIRWGGEEFLVVSRRIHRQQIAEVSERFRSGIQDHSFQLEEGAEMRCTCSIGFAPYPFYCSDPEAMGWEEVLNVADRCLYAAKNAGRNAWVGLIPPASADATVFHRQLDSEPNRLIARHPDMLLTSVKDRQNVELAV